MSTENTTVKVSTAELFGILAQVAEAKAEATRCAGVVGALDAQGWAGNAYMLEVAKGRLRRARAEEGFLCGVRTGGVQF